MILSIITVCYNSEKTMAETIQSIDDFIRNSPDSIEHLIIDGCSNDSTLAIINALHKPWRRVISAPDDGIYDAMNKGSINAKGTYVWFVNSDDIIHPSMVADSSALLSQLRLEAHDVIFGSIDMFRTNRNKVVRTWAVPDKNILRAIQFGWTPSHQGSIIKNSLIKELGGFDLKYDIASDIHLLLRALLITNIKKVSTSHLRFVLFRLGGDSNGSFYAILKGNIEYYKVRRALGSSIIQSFFLTLSKLLRKIIQFV